MKTIHPNFHKLIAVDDTVLLKSLGLFFFCLHLQQGCIYLLKQNTAKLLTIFTV